jgi:hypothetical protein
MDGELELVYTDNVRGDKAELERALPLMVTAWAKSS